jgi:hypothetical protein
MWERGGKHSSARFVRGVVRLDVGGEDQQQSGWKTGIYQKVVGLMKKNGFEESF